MFKKHFSNVLICAFFSYSVFTVLTACQKNVNGINSTRNENYTQQNKSIASILGGEIVKPGDIVAHSTVAIKLINGKKAYPMCTGTLISPNLILTASHCLEGMAKSELRIGFSIESKDVLDEETMYEIEDFVIHPRFGEGRLNDIALIKISQFAPESYKPVAVLPSNYQLTVGMPMLLAGYGVINDDTGDDTQALRKVIVPLSKILNEESILVTDQTNTMGACNGDSGGPAYLEKDGVLYVYGITRGPHQNAEDCHHYGEYTYASKFESFIIDSAKKLNALY